MEWILASSHKRRLQLVEQAVDWCAQEMVKAKQHHQNKSEDELTTSLLIPLTAMGMDATHDTQIGGHVDITVRGADDFLWLAEAKKHGTYPWLLDGFEQLDRRYSTGLPGQDCGEMLVYHFGRNSQAVLDEYELRLNAARPDVAFDKSAEVPLTKRSTHRHAATGSDFSVRHRIVPLFFQPTK